jgi:hypothetical protein
MYACGYFLEVGIGTATNMEEYVLCSSIVKPIIAHTNLKGIIVL